MSEELGKLPSLSRVRLQNICLVTEFLSSERLSDPQKQTKKIKTPQKTKKTKPKSSCLCRVKPAARKMLVEDFPSTSIVLGLSNTGSVYEALGQFGRG